MALRGQVAAAMAAVVSPLVFALAVPGVFPAADAGARVGRPTLPQGQVLRSGKPPSPRGATLWVNPSPAADAVSRTLSVRPTDAALLRKIASKPQATWLTEWLTPSNATTYVAGRARTAAAGGSVPVFVVYGVPIRDCGGFSGGGLGTSAGYRAWVDGISKGLAGRRAVVVVEPDGLASMDCLTTAQQRQRTALLAYAVDRLGANPGVSVYLDAGHSRWHPAAVMAARLKAAGVERARGFALNVAAFDPTPGEIEYGRKIGVALGGPVPFVVDTSRNGKGRWEGTLSWCNPPGRALGTPPTTNHPDPLVDALLWVKTPGMSDGLCRGGPGAGKWWQSYALTLARNASW